MASIKTNIKKEEALVVKAKAIEAIFIKTKEALHYLKEIILIKIFSKTWLKLMQLFKPLIKTVYYALKGIKMALLTLIAIIYTLITIY